MNYSESMSKRQQRRKALNQRFRRMFLVALLMGLAMGFIFGRCSAVNSKAPDAPIEPDQLTTVTPDVTLEPVETPLVEEPAEPEPVLLGSFRITAYCSCEKCCGEWAKNRPNGIVYGAAGVELKAGVSCASPLPLGTAEEVEGLGEYKYRLRYVEGIDTIPNTDADNALILGTALHTGIEEGVEQALDFYKNSFPVLTDDHIHEMMKLEAMIPKAKAMLPPGGTFELPIGNSDFIGFMDYLVPVGKGLKLDGLITGEDLNEFEAFDLYDFKYSNNAKNYAVSGQLHEYKYWYELTHPGHRIRNMYFLIVPKPKIRQKSTETLSQFRDRLQAALKDSEPTLMPVQYNPMKIVDFLTDVKHMVEATDFLKNPNHFCGWCEYEEYCQKGWDYMLLPKNERRDLNATKKKVVWLYGAPFSGKTFFANQFPDPLMLNTDGNIKFVDAPYIAIRDTVTVEGRITKRKLAYEVFMDAVAELEKKQNDFRTIVVDLLEDVYESCRVYICDRQGWKHESDDSFRAWDMVRSEFLNTLKRLVNLDYENIILISHEDRSRDLTRKGGDKISSIKPNLQDKVANKVAGMKNDALNHFKEEMNKRGLFRKIQVCANLIPPRPVLMVKP